MIRKLTDADRGMLMQYLEKQPALNLFLIGDVENFGMEQPFMEIWGEFDEAGAFRAVLLRYYRSYLCYAEGSFDVDGLSAIIRRDPDAEMVSGAEEVVGAFRSALQFRKEKPMYFAEMTALADTNIGSPAGHPPIRIAEMEDVEKICVLLDGIEEFESDSRQGLHRTLESGTGRVYYAEEEGRVVAVASTTAENSKSAMVVGVATDPAMRGRGMATRIVGSLCADVLAEGRTLCLFYNNPDAGKIYKRLGFRDIGRWLMMYF